MLTFVRGQKFFELTNHLGNVLATVADGKIGVPSGSVVSYYTAVVVSAQDYYPFGMLEPGRQYSTGTQYKFGFNGQEKSEEIAPNTTTAEYWEYDARIGRRWNVDPVVKTSESPYLCFSGSPILLGDPLGNTPDWTKKSNADGSTQYKWDDNATNPATKPGGYTYVGPTGHYPVDYGEVNLNPNGNWFRGSGVSMSSGSKGTQPPVKEASSSAPQGPPHKGQSLARPL